jgi:hypothetical protein
MPFTAVFNRKAFQASRNQVLVGFDYPLPLKFGGEALSTIIV